MQLYVAIVFPHKTPAVDFQPFYHITVYPFGGDNLQGPWHALKTTLRRLPPEQFASPHFKVEVGLAIDVFK
jgi:hypothetical protein